MLEEGEKGRKEVIAATTLIGHQRREMVCWQTVRRESPEEGGEVEGMAMKKGRDAILAWPELSLLWVETT